MKTKYDHLIRQLSSSELGTRLEAARRLAELGASEAHFALNYQRATEVDPATREVLHAAIQRLEEQLAQLPLTASLPGLLASVRSILATDHPSEATRAAALRTLDFIEELGTEATLPAPASSALEPESVHSQSIPELIYILQGSRKEWRRRAEGALYLHGSEAVKPLCRAFVGATPLFKRRLISVLSDIDDLAALPTLWTAWREGLEGDNGVSLKVALLRLGVQLPEHPDKVPMQELLPVLAECKEHLPALAKQIAQALEHWAETTPTPELRDALPLLKGTWIFPVPSALEKARRAIETATADWVNLPIAADTPGAVADSLPVPAEPNAPSKSSANLPRPGKAS